MSLKQKRVLAGAILHETNTFNAIPTRLADFAGRYLLYGTDAARARLAGTATEIGGLLRAADLHGWDIVVAVAAAGGPSGPLAAPDWAALKARLLDIDGPFDGVALALHGAMVTEDSLDPEGELLDGLRLRHGARVPIVATLDMHANVSTRMVAAADAFFPYRTYPHIDHADCAIDAATALDALMEAARRPGNGRLTRSVLARPPMLDAADHGRTNPPGPMNALLARASEIAEHPGVVSAGLTIGFPWSDVAEAGPAAIVTVRADTETAPTPEDPVPPDPVAFARDLAERLWESRAQTQLDFPGVADAIALAKRDSDDARPLLLVDFADNPAGGAYGDSPNLLRAMVDAGLENAAFATLADPEAVRLAAEAGEGATLDLSLGGRHAPEIGPPLDIRVRVARLHDGRFECEGPMLRGLTVDMGAMAVLEAGGLRIVVASRALAVTDLNLFRSVGIEPASLRTIGLKSRNHLRAAFGPIARGVVLVDAGGIATMRLSHIPYRRIDRSVWPLTPVDPSRKLENAHVFDTASRSEE
ncbi:M81 family metallopeptidase [Microbaculum sp. FT89]|uniref:M81 family metallopeptidase n=1 Tax=Microbaculum sp. FT89 TaxID=3447298 RepID=UPI003F53A2F0